MLTMTFGKLLLVVLVIVAVWKGARLLAQVQKRLAEQQNRPRPPQGKSRSEPRATDLVECPRCGLYVPNGTFCPSKEQCKYRTG